MKKVFLQLIILSLFVLVVNAQDGEAKESPRKINFGAYLGGNFNLHSPDLNFSGQYNMLPMNYTEPVFNSNASVLGFNGGLIFNHGITDMFLFTARIGYHTLSADLDGEAVINPLPENHTLEQSLGMLEITPGVQVYNLLPVDNLYLLGALDMGFLVNNEYNITSSADDQVFAIDGQELPNSNTRFAIAIGAGYEIAFNEKWILTPEVSYRLPLTDVSNADFVNGWSASQLRLSVSLAYDLSPDEEPEIESVLYLEIDGTFYNEKKERKAVDNIVVEEVQYSELYPIIPFVFMEAGKSTPVAETQTLASQAKTGAFSLDELKPNAVSINKYTLDVIGERLKKYPEAKLTLTGTNDGSSERNNITLSRQRAEFAKDYLVKNYKVNASNITVKATNLPQKASGTRTEDGREENRRVEIESNFPEILEPILIKQDKQSYATPGLIEFDTRVESSDTVQSWVMEISQSDRIVKRLKGKGEPRTIKWKIEPNDLLSKPVPVDYTLTVTDKKGKSDTKSGSIPIEFFSFERKRTEERPDKSISKFSLIVFDFDSPEISDEDKDILEKHVLQAIKYNSKIQIYGYTDRIGDTDYNQKLALKRAEKVKEFLQPKAKSAKIEVFGIGENIELFDNDVTIGRQLSRTVQVYVITPKEK